jgi:DNA primase
MFDVKQFLIDYSIPKNEEGPDTSPGWINIQCPFCDDSVKHLGLPLNGNSSNGNCWKCGAHWIPKIISTVIDVSIDQAKEIISEYSTNSVQVLKKKNTNKSNKIIIELPIGTKELKLNHKEYLIKRNFDPNKLEKIWDLKGTGPIGDYKLRIIAPIYYRNIVVSYQGRDITNKQKLRYKACSKENEVLHHKHLLYGIDKVKNRKGILVEGITDVWRLGEGAVASFGTSYHQEQVNFISKHFDEIFILFDPGDKIAYKKATSLVWSLQGLNTKAHIINIDFDGDPADLKQKEADYIKKHLLGE